MTMALGHVRAAAGQERDMGAEEADEPLKNLGGKGEARGGWGRGWSGHELDKGGFSSRRDLSKSWVMRSHRRGKRRRNRSEDGGREGSGQVKTLCSLATNWLAGLPMSGGTGGVVSWGCPALSVMSPPKLSRVSRGIHCPVWWHSPGSG